MNHRFCRLLPYTGDLNKPYLNLTSSLVDSLLGYRAALQPSNQEVCGNDSQVLGVVRYHRQTCYVYADS